MPVYFFHVRYKEPSPDDDGLVLADAHAAWTQATQACGEMIRDMNGNLEPGRELRMEVADEHGKMLFALRMYAEVYD